MGFILEHAYARCDALANLQSNVDMDGILTWIIGVENCNIMSLDHVYMQHAAEEVTRDPVTCLRLEKKILEKVNECYSNNAPQLCQLLGDSVNATELQDLNRLVSTINVGGEYYTATVNSGIPKLVRQCGHSETADSLYIGRPTYRLIFCMWANSANVTAEDYVQFLSRHLNDSESNFQYGGTSMHRTCAASIPPSTQLNTCTGTYDFHVVTWFAAPNNSVARNWNEVTATVGNISGGAITIGFYEYTTNVQDYLSN